MGDLHARRAAFLAAKNRQHASAPWEYIRPGAPSIELPVTKGRSEWDVDRGGGAIERVISEDLIVNPEDLLVAAEPVEPQPGDRARGMVGGKRYTFEVQSLGHNEPCWRYVDSQRQRIRIHVHQIKVEQL